MTQRFTLPDDRRRSGGSSPPSVVIGLGGEARHLGPRDVPRGLLRRALLRLDDGALARLTHHEMAVADLPIDAGRAGDGAQQAI